jgi:hypothetical protein
MSVGIIQLEGFSLNLIFEYFLKICRENLSFIKTIREDKYIYIYIYIYNYIYMYKHIYMCDIYIKSYIYINTYRSVLLRMKNA